jgi:hypothetical protein
MVLDHTPMSPMGPMPDAINGRRRAAGGGDGDTSTVLILL